AYKLGCKGLTVYRDKSLDQQVIQVSHAKRFDQKEEQKGQNPFLRCSECGASLQFSQGKGLCQVCGTELLQ
ncbi:MAG: hypothetical protein QXF14_04845, partial [Candidatus Woesearchaeota archaeon]